MRKGTIPASELCARECLLDPTICRLDSLELYRRYGNRDSEDGSVAAARCSNALVSRIDSDYFIISVQCDFGDLSALPGNKDGSTAG